MVVTGWLVEWQSRLGAHYSVVEKFLKEGPLSAFAGKGLRIGIYSFFRGLSQFLALMVLPAHTEFLLNSMTRDQKTSFLFYMYEVKCRSM